MFLFSSRRTIPLNELPSGSLKPDILPVWPFCIKVSTCFWVSFLPCISIGIRKSQDFRYRVHPQAVFPFTISPCPHLGHFNTTAIFSPFSFFPFPFSLSFLVFLSSSSFSSGHLIGTVFDHAQLLFPLPCQLCRFQKVVLNGVDELYTCRCC